MHGVSIFDNEGSSQDAQGNGIPGQETSYESASEIINIAENGPQDYANTERSDAPLIEAYESPSIKPSVYDKKPSSAISKTEKVESIASDTSSHCWKENPVPSVP